MLQIYFLEYNKLPQFTGIICTSPGSLILLPKSNCFCLFANIVLYKIYKNEQ